MATEQEGDDDIPVLSEYALAALQEFYQEQGTKQECVNTVQEDWVIIISNNNNNNSLLIVTEVWTHVLFDTPSIIIPCIEYHILTYMVFTNGLSLHVTQNSFTLAIYFL